MGAAEEPGGHEARRVSRTKGRCNSCLRKRVGMENTMIAARCPCQRGTAARVCETQICISARARTVAAIWVRGSAQRLHRAYDHLYADRELPGGRGSSDPSSPVWLKDAVWDDMLLVSSCNWISRGRQQGKLRHHACSSATSASESLPCQLLAAQAVTRGNSEAKFIPSAAF